MTSQANTGGRVPPVRNSPRGAAVLDRTEIAASMMPSGRLQEEALRLVGASRAGRPSGDNRQLRVLAQTVAREVEELITQTYIGGHAKMKLAVDNLAAAAQALQIEMAR